VKPEDGVAAVAAESLSRLASVGLQYGFFIGCLGPVDDKIGQQLCPASAASSGAKFGCPAIAAKQLAGKPDRRRRPPIDLLTASG
jgi:hypothetical protein